MKEVLNIMIRNRRLKPNPFFEWEFSIFSFFYLQKFTKSRKLKVSLSQTESSLKSNLDSLQDLQRHFFIFGLHIHIKNHYFSMCISLASSLLPYSLYYGLINKLLRDSFFFFHLSEILSHRSPWVIFKGSFRRCLSFVRRE